MSMLLCHLHPVVEFSLWFVDDGMRLMVGHVIMVWVWWLVVRVGTCSHWYTCCYIYICSVDGYGRVVSYKLVKLVAHTYIQDAYRLINLTMFNSCYQLNAWSLESGIYIPILCKTWEYLRTQGAAIKLLQVHRLVRKRRCSATLCLPIRVAGRSSTLYSELGTFGMVPKGIWRRRLLLYRFIFCCVVAVSFWCKLWKQLHV